MSMKDTLEQVSAEIRELLNQQKSIIASGMPVGTIVSFAVNNVPAGFLVCDGSPFDGSVYPALAAHLGGTVLPDYRAEFLRGADLGRGIDSGRVPNTAQAAQVKTNMFRIISADGPDFVYSLGAGTSQGLGSMKTFFPDAGTTETRPRNVSVVFAIKATDSYRNPAFLDVTALAQKVMNIEAATRRVKLTADTTYYIRQDGNDANDGLENIPSRAFATLQGAFNYLRYKVDACSHIVYFSLSPGVHNTDSISCYGFDFNARVVSIRSTDAANKAEIVLNASVSVPWMFLIRGCTINVSNVNLNYGARNDANFLVFNVQHNATVTLSGAITIKGSGTLGYIFASQVRSSITFDSSANITLQFTAAATMFSVLLCSALSYAEIAGYLTITGAAITVSFALLNAVESSSVHISMTSKITSNVTVTGKKYAADSLAAIRVTTGDLTTLPGTAAGTAINGSIAL